MYSLYTTMLLVLTCLFILCGAGCSGNGEDQSSAALKQPITETTKPEQAIIKVSFSKVPNNVRAVGMLQAYQEVEISSEISGKIKKIHCVIGE